MKQQSRSWIWILAATLVLAAPLSALAVDIPVPAKVHLIKQDGGGGPAKLAKIVNKPLPKGSVFALPSSAPTSVGGTLKFFKVGTPGVWDDIALPSGQWFGIGNPSGSKGFKYRGTGSPTDPCKVIIVKPKVIKAVCKGPGAFDSPSPYSLPVGPLGAAWELVIGGDKYCAESSTATGATVKKDDGAKGLYKAIKANAPAVCPIAVGPVATPTPTPPPPTPTPPYGSASKAFLSPAQGLLE
jgi:hypothetical protein